MTNSFRKRLIANVGLFLGSLCACFMLAEIVMHVLAKPSDKSSGSFLGMELPPLRTLPAHKKVRSHDYEQQPADDWCAKTSPTGELLTRGDIYGLLKEHDTIGFVPRENAVSVNGWWQSNNLGARSRYNVATRQEPGVKRVLLFGDSYAQGSRVSQEETIAHYISVENPSWETLNFGVDGYSLGQAYLRYRELKHQLEFDHLILVFVAIADLWREINVNRNIGQGWDSYMIYPRFILEGGSLQLVPGPYLNIQELVNENSATISPSLKTHLQKYDAFYFDSRYEHAPELDWSVTYRLYRRYLSEKRHSEIWNNLMEPQSEAMMLTKATAAAMAEEVTEQGSKFTFTILPTLQEIEMYRNNPSWRVRWHKMTSTLCNTSFACEDLMGYLIEVPLSELDVVCDNWHFGPKTNEQVAKVIVKTVLK